MNDKSENAYKTISEVTRILNLVNLIENSEKWTKNSPIIKDQQLTIYTIDLLKKHFTFDVKELYWI